MKESLIRRTAAATLGLTLAFGATACSNPFNHEDPNDIPECGSNWVDNGIGANVDDLRVTDMAQAMSELEAGRSQLVTAIHSEIGTSYNMVKTSAVPPQYKVAASLLINRINDYWYDTSKAELDTPAEEFCHDDYGFDQDAFKSPDYVKAEGALAAAGIDIHAQEVVE